MEIIMVTTVVTLGTFTADKIESINHKEDPLAQVVVKERINSPMGPNSKKTMTKNKME
jgi:hypothetical protein